MFSHGLGLPCRPSIKTLRVVVSCAPKAMHVWSRWVRLLTKWADKLAGVQQKTGMFWSRIASGIPCPKKAGLIEDLDDPQPADTKEDAQDTAQINRKRTRATMCCSTKCMQLQTTVTPVGAVMLRSARARAQVCYSIQTTAMPVRAV